MKIFLIICIFSIVFGKYREDCKGKENHLPAIIGKTNFIKEIPHGKLLEISDGKGNTLPILKLQGTPKEMGFAYGQLLGTEIKKCFTAFIIGLKNFIKRILFFLPDFISQGIVEVFWVVAKYMGYATYFLQKPYIDPWFLEELEGLSLGSGIDYYELVVTNIFPETFDAACSMLSVWGEATPNHQVLLLRTLDFDKYNGMNAFPIIVIYNSTTKNSAPFANIGYMGLIGSLTAVSSRGIATAEKKCITNSWDITKTKLGKPWHFVLRNVAEFDRTVEDIERRLNSTQRTCSVHLGFASSASKKGVAAIYSYGNVQYFRDYTYNNSIHPAFPSTIYWDKEGHPTSKKCFGELVREFYGKITTEIMWKYLAALDQTGDSQMCAMDPNTLEIYVSYSDPKKEIDAFDRAPFYVDLKPYFFNE